MLCAKIVKPRMHYILHLFTVCKLVSIYCISEQSQNMVIRWDEIWTIRWVGEKLEFQFANNLNGCIRLSIDMIEGGLNLSTFLFTYCKE
jgi:hypothetical protein